MISNGFGSGFGSNDGDGIYNHANQWMMLAASSNIIVI